jgi:hypothetical protein
VLAGPVLASRRTTSMRVLLARGLQRVGQLGGGLGHRGVDVDDVGQVVAAAGLVELLGWAAAAGTGSQLVGRTRPLGVSHGSPRQSRLKRSRMSVAHRARGLGQRPQSVAKAGVGRCLLSKVTLETYAQVLERRDREQIGRAFDHLLVGGGRRTQARAARRPIGRSKTSARPGRNPG